MPRSPSLPLHDYDDLDFSSPDPLATSQIDENYIRGATRSPSPMKRTIYSSPSKRRTIGVTSRNATPQRQSSSQWIRGDMNSPSKTVTEQTLSPWKIRVTVETEPEEADLEMRSTRTRTMKIPLRDASSPAEDASGGRKSQANSAKGKRRSTPIRKNSRTRRQSVTDLNITVLGDDGESNDWTKQRSPSKKRRPSRSRKSEQISDGIATTETPAPEPASAKPKRKTRVSQKPVEIREDTDAETEGGNLEDAVQDGDSPELRSIDLNRVSVRPRSTSSRQRTTSIAQDAPDQQNQERGENYHQETQANMKLVAEDPRQAPGRPSYPTPDPSTQNSDDAQVLPADQTDDHEGFDTILESEGFTMIDLELIPSARNFYSSPLEAQTPGEAIPEPVEIPAEKITIETPSQNQVNKNPMVPASIRPRPTPIPSYLTLNEGESDMSSNVPSSPPVPQPRQLQPRTSNVSCAVRQVTPQPYSSPKLPPPPQAQSAGTGQAPRLVKVIKAGIALQGVLSPKENPGNPTSLNPGSSRTPKERLDDLFEGFDSGTRRELRAGLRLGEELAKRQRPILRVLSAGNRSSMSQEKAQDNNVNTRRASPLRSLPTTQVRRAKAFVQRTPVQLVAEPDLTAEMTEKHTLPSGASASQVRKRQKSLELQENRLSSTPSKANIGIPSSAVLNTQAAREKQWQLEREAISRQIENTSKDQVITIDSDDELQLDHIKASNTEIMPESDDEDVDLWTEQAVSSADQRKRSDSPKVSKPTGMANLFPTEERRNQLQRARDITIRPRRSLIPSPWKRGHNVADDNTMLTNGDMTGLFDHDPKSKIGFAGAEIERQRRQLGSSFDVDRMAGTPAKEEVAQEDATGPLEGSNICSDDEDESFETEASDMKQLQNELDIEQSRIETDGVSEDENSELETEAREGFPRHHQDWKASQEGLSPREEISFRQPDLDHESQEHAEHVEDAEISHLNFAADQSLTSLSSQPQAVKIPVNFNDSTISRSAIICPSPSTPEELEQPSPGPATPRSAMKGVRASLGLEISEELAAGGKRKVVFSKEQTWRFEDGEEMQHSAKSASPASSVSLSESQGEVQPAVALSDAGSLEDVGAEPEEVENKIGSGSWVGWLWSGTKTSPSPSLSQAASTPVPAMDGRAETDANGVEREKTKSSIPCTDGTTSSSCQLNTEPTAANVPSYLLPPSYPSDPTRDPNIPLLTSGQFTTTHFRTLHIIHAKSLRPRFHGPSIDEVRPALKGMIGEKFEVDESESGLGVFEWTVNELAVRAVERWYREVEWGWVCCGKGKGKGKEKGAVDGEMEGKAEVDLKWAWSERQVVGWLCRVVVGEEVRKEERKVAESVG